MEEKIVSKEEINKHCTYNLRWLNMRPDIPADAFLHVSNSGGIEKIEDERCRCVKNLHVPG